MSAIFFFLFIYGFIGVMTGMMSMMIFMEVDDLPVSDSEAAVATGVLWPISLPVFSVYGIYKAVSITTRMTAHAFTGLWTAYVNRVEERVR